MTEVEQNSMEDIALTLDNGVVLDFRGYLFSEASWYDDDGGVLTHHKLYVTDRHEQVYFVVTATGNARSRRAYRIAVQGDTCAIDNGRFEMVLPFDLLINAVRSLCGLEEGAIPTLDLVEETLRAANC
jgi:hypothetical protein